MLTFAMPQSEPRADKNVSASRTSRREDARREPLRHVVVQRDRLVEIAVAHHVKDRRERLVAYDRGLRGHLDDRRMHVVGVRLCGSCDALAAAHVAAFALALRSSARCIAVERGRVDQRSDQRAGVERIADLEPP